MAECILTWFFRASGKHRAPRRGVNSQASISLKVNGMITVGRWLSSQFDRFADVRQTKSPARKSASRT